MSRVQAHVHADTHTFIFDSHIDHRTCHKMSKSDYLINVYSTRRWPSYEFIYFFFLICCVLVLHTLDIRHQFKYVFMLYGQYKKKREISTIRPTHTHIGGTWSVAACVCVCEYAVHKGDLLCACLYAYYIWYRLYVYDCAMCDLGVHVRVCLHKDFLLFFPIFSAFSFNRNPFI